MTTSHDVLEDMRTRFSTVIVGNDDACKRLVQTYVIGGHVLLEGVPGTAKTLMARTMSKILSVGFKRVQFTPDLLPSDIIGSNMYRQDTQEFSFRKGPLFTDILLADEINRAPAKTQAALLESMEERQVSADGTTYPLGERFYVIATQNPVEFEGTYQLPEAEIDRFTMKLVVDLLPKEQERELVERVDKGFDARNLDEIDLGDTLSWDSIVAAREEAAAVQCDPDVLSYITDLCGATRHAPEVLRGASHRASVTLVRIAKVEAAMAGRDFVTPDDIRSVTLPVLRHRVTRTAEAELHGISEDEVINRIVDRIAVPR